MGFHSDGALSADVLINRFQYLWISFRLFRGSLGDRYVPVRIWCRGGDDCGGGGGGSSTWCNISRRVLEGTSAGGTGELSSL